MSEFYEFDKNAARDAVSVVPGVDYQSEEAQESDKIGRGYVIRDGSLVAAINAALILGKPLLLTGKPGTGKTRLANRIAWFLKLGGPLKFETKSTSVARDLFYTYDALGRFQSMQPDHAAVPQNGHSRSALDFITFSALGQAVLRSQQLAKLPDLLRSPQDNGLHDNVRRALGMTVNSSNHHPRQSLVLIDEMDKASRDFPNDLLNELDRLFFRIVETRSDQEIRADRADNLRPIIIITSNSEKNLPDAFLRRCIYHHIEFPNRNTLREILLSQVSDVRGTTLLNSCIAFFEIFRNQLLQKEPSTAELVDWVQLLARCGVNDSQPLSEQTQFFERTRATLAKTEDDRTQLQRSWDEFLKLKPVNSEAFDSQTTQPATSREKEM